MTLDDLLKETSFHLRMLDGFKCSVREYLSHDIAQKVYYKNEEIEPNRLIDFIDKNGVFNFESDEDRFWLYFEIED